MKTFDYTKAMWEDGNRGYMRHYTPAQVAQLNRLTEYVQTIGYTLDDMPYHCPDLLGRYVAISVDYCEGYFSVDEDCICYTTFDDDGTDHYMRCDENTTPQDIENFTNEVN